MIVLLGESASGKTTLLKMFVEKHPEFRKVVTFTTRPKRNGEVNGVDYHFISKATYSELLKRNMFIEHAQYRGWDYATGKLDCDVDNGIVILTPAGLRALKRYGYNVKSIYLYVDKRSRLMNILARGDDIDEAYRRNLSDQGQFDGLVDEVDYVIDNTEFHMDEEQTLKCLEEIVFPKDDTNSEYEQLSLFAEKEKDERHGQ